MKNQSNKSNKTKFIARVMISVAILLLASTMACTHFLTQQTDVQHEINIGYDVSQNSGTGEEINPLWVACKSDTNEFNINDVTLNFSFGYPLPYLKYIIGSVSCPVYKIYFTNEEKEILIKTVEKELISEQYSVKGFAPSDYNDGKLTYNITEVLTIPAELFSKESGIVSFIMEAENVMYPYDNDAYGRIAFEYKRIGEKVVLSVVWPKYNIEENLEENTNSATMVNIDTPRQIKI